MIGYPGVTVVSFDIGGTVARIGAGSITSQLAVALDRDFRTVRTALQQFKTVRTSPADLAHRVCNLTGRPAAFSAVLAVLEQAKRYTSRLVLFEDVQPTLALLRERGLRVVLLSNVVGCAAPSAGCAPPLDSFMDGVYYSCDLGHAKPDFKAFHEVTRRLNVLPEQVLHVGDAWNTDVLGAVAAGWHSLLLDRAALGDGPRSISSLRSLPGRLDGCHGLAVVPTRGVTHAS